MEGDEGSRRHRGDHKNWVIGCGKCNVLEPATSNPKDREELATCRVDKVLEGVQIYAAWIVQLESKRIAAESTEGDAKDAMCCLP